MIQPSFSTLFGRSKASFARIEEHSFGNLVPSAFLLFLEGVQQKFVLLRSPGLSSFRSDDIQELELKKIRIFVEE